MSPSLSPFAFLLATFAYAAIEIIVHSHNQEDQDVLQGLMSIALWPLILTGWALSKTCDRIQRARSQSPTPA